MRFKDWLEDGSGGIAIGLNGTMDSPLSMSNSNMPAGVRSKYSTKESPEEDDFQGKKPEVSFGFQRPSDRKASIERDAKTIHRIRKGVPIRDDRPVL